MNKLNVLLANNSEMLFEHCIKAVKPLLCDFSLDNIIIVPDRLSLKAEQKIFDLLDISVYFNLTVMGISKFATKIIKENGLSNMECSAFEAKLLTLKAIQNVKNSFKCFSKNITLGLADELFAKIEQIKSSSANINDLVSPDATAGEMLKFNDIKLVYNEYEKLRAGRLDSGAMLSLFNSIAAESEYLKKCNVFFVGFDSMTRQGIEVLSNVVKNCHFALLGVVAPNNQANYNIYDQSFYNMVLTMCKENNFEGEHVWLNQKLTNVKNNILTNIFTRQNVYGENNYIKLCSAVTSGDEIDYVVKSINYKLKTSGLRFKDISICAPADYHAVIKSRLQDLGIECFSDTKTKLISLEPVKYLLNYFKYVYDKNTDNLIEVITNDFCDLTCKDELQNYLAKYLNLNSVIKYENNLNEQILSFIAEFKDFDTILKNTQNYLKNIKKIIKNSNFYEKINNFCNIFENKGEILLQKTYLQIEKKLEDIFNLLENVFYDQEMSFTEFCELFEKSLIEGEISGVPSCTDEVFIGDTKSFYYDTKILYVLGANEGAFPEVLSDNGLISDKEIQTVKAVLEPTTKVINKRNKFKALEILLMATDECYVTYHQTSAEGKTVQPSEFVTELKYLLNIKEIAVQDLKIYSNNPQVSQLCFNCVNPYYANLALSQNLPNQVLAIIKGSLIKTGNMFFKPVKNLPKADFNKLFFAGGKASISKIEKYNSCPKAAFLASGLKLKKQQKDKIELNVIGSFIHEVAEKFVKQNIKKLGLLSEDDVNDCVDAIVKTLTADEYFAIYLEDNVFILKQIIAECKRFCNFINYEQTISEFKPVYTEKYFGGEHFKPIMVNVGGKEYKIAGIIDRIDMCDDYFRIVDYKTGETSNARGKEQLFYGTKVQLFVYAKAAKDNLNKKLFGAFYLPIKNKFLTVKSSEYSYSGFFENNASLVKKSDCTVGADNPKSSILNCAFAKPKESGELTLKSKNNILSAEELDAYMNYAIEQVKTTIKNMQDGFIDCSPLKNKCQLCEFNKICISANNEKVEREEEFEIVSKTFLELNYDN